MILGVLLVSGFNAFADLSEDGKVVQDRVTVECKTEQGNLNFTLNRSTQVAVFTQTSAIGSAQMPLNEPIAALIDGPKLNITYDWYFTAEYELSFPKSVRALKAGDKADMHLSGDDDDGFIANDKLFACTVK
jgi:hypothetical protein